MTKVLPAVNHELSVSIHLQNLTPGKRCQGGPFLRLHIPLTLKMKLSGHMGHFMT